MNNMSSGQSENSMVTYTIEVNGSPIPTDYDILSIDVNKPVNGISAAKISISEDGGADKEPGDGFQVSSSSTFVPGNKLSISAGYEGKNKVIFQGIITGQNLSVHPSIGAILSVECHDKAIAMTVGRKNASFANKSDSEIIGQIIKTNGLSANVQSTPIKWPELTQYYTTDWDFIVSRAEVNGLIVTTINGKVSAFSPGSDTSPVITISYGDNLLSFDADLDAMTQLERVKASSWDFQNQERIYEISKTSNKGPGNLNSSTLARAMNTSDYELQTTGPLTKKELGQWSKAQLVKSDYAKILGALSLQGSSLIEPGKYVTLDGLGNRFNGDHIVSEVSHTIESGNWTTSISIGLSPHWLCQEPDVMAPPASGLLPGIQGLYNATVKKMYADPDNQYRIQVDIPLIEKGEGIWARLANFYATSGGGAFFLPEVGDEVIVGFLNEDPRFPVIMGSLYSATRHRPAKGLTPVKDNNLKAIVSKSGVSVEFDDKRKSLSFTTPGKNTISLDDKAKNISVKDRNGNSIVMSSSGISIKSSKSISIDAGGSLSLKGKTGVNIQASAADVSMKGINIKNQANVQFEAKGDMLAKLEGGAQTIVKGALVKIN